MLTRIRSLVDHLGFAGALKYLAARIGKSCFMPHARWSWSQFGEDLVARDILGLEKDWYVDVGCNDPEKWSNTYLFYLHGWRGVLVDANQQLIDACRRKRPADAAVCCLLGDTEGEREIAIYDEHALSSAIDDHNVARRGTAKLLERRRVHQTTLTALLVERGVPEKFGFLSIDVEGMDLMVLQGLDLTRFRPRLIAVEDAAYKPLLPEESKVVRHLTERGYRLYSHIHPTLFFVAADAEPKAFHGPVPGGPNG